MTDTILVVNAGSSSLKFSAFAFVPGEEPSLRFKGQMEGIGVRPRLKARSESGEVLVDRNYERSDIGGHDAAIATISQWLRGVHKDGRLLAVGHRVVHGGVDHAEPVLIDDGILKSLEALVPL